MNATEYHTVIELPIVRAEEEAAELIDELRESNGRILRANLVWFGVMTYVNKVKGYYGDDIQTDFTAGTITIDNIPRTRFITDKHHPLNKIQEWARQYYLKVDELEIESSRLFKRVQFSCSNLKF